SGNATVRQCSAMGAGAISMHSTELAGVIGLWPARLVQHPIATSTHAVLDHARFFLFRLLRLAAAAHHGACPSAAGCPARAAEDGSDQAAVNGAADGTFGRIA